MVIETIELVSAAIGCGLVWCSAIQRRFRNFATSVFLLCYVPLFCVYPVIGRLLSGGAISVDSRLNATLADPYIYYIYQTYNIIILFGCFLVLLISPLRPETQTEGVPFHQHTPFSTVGLLSLIALGVFLYVYSTGLSLSELLIASRFEWFLNDNYSSFLSVVASYLIALAPALVYVCARDDRRKMLVIALVILVGYGVLSKDRKWLIFIASGLLAAHYVKTNLQIKLSRRSVTLLALLGIALAFWQVARGVIFNSVVMGTNDLGTEVFLMIEQLLTRGDLPYYYNASATAISMNFNDGYSIPFGLLRRQLFFFLPVDFSIGLKIEDISAIFSDAVAGGDDTRRGNMPPGFIGLLVLSFDWWGGLLVVLGLPVLLRAFDNLIRCHSGIVQIAVISNFLSAVLLLLRGDDSSASYFMIFTIIVLFMLKQWHQLSFLKPRAASI